MPRLNTRFPDPLPWSEVARPLARAEDVLARLDERLRTSPIRDGWITRTHFADAAAALWLEGELVHLEDLVLHDAGMDIRAPTREVTRGHTALRARRRIAAAAPGWALSPAGLEALRGRARQANATHPKPEDTPAEGALLAVNDAAGLAVAWTLAVSPSAPPFVVLELAESLAPAELAAPATPRSGVVLLRRFGPGQGAALAAFAALARGSGWFLACDLTPEAAADLGPQLERLGAERLIFTCGGVPGDRGSPRHAVGAYRRIAEELRRRGLRAPLWIRNTDATAVQGDNSFLSKLLEASFLTGSLLGDGLGDLVSIETERDAPRSVRLAYNVLQGAGARISKTEFVACPSCGRTLFDLQATTQRIRAQTGHLKGVKLAIMGCIVNGPGEMADADFGYVGGAPGKINLYVGKQCVQYNLPQAEADARLIALIKEHGRWVDAPVTPAAPA